MSSLLSAMLYPKSRFIPRNPLIRLLKLTLFIWMTVVRFVCYLLEKQKLAFGSVVTEHLRVL